MKRGFVLLVLVWACCLPVSVAAASPPTIEYFAPSSIRNHEATLNFSIDPEGLATEFEIKYGTVPGVYNPYTYWESELPAGNEPVTLKFKMPPYWAGKLGAGTEYHWYVTAKNAAGTTEGAVQHFTTTNGPKPVFVTGSASTPTSTSASFSGTVDPEGFPLTGCRFRYVTETVHKYAGFEKWAATEMARFGETVPCEESFAEIGSGTEPVTVHAQATIPTPGVYWVRLEGENAYEDAAASGPGIEFDTLAPPLLVICGSGGCHSTSDPLTEAFPTSTPSAAPLAGLPPQVMKKHGKKLKKHRRQLRRNAALVAPR